jgi:hypothetical protein
MLCAGPVSLKARSMATASVLVPPGIKRYLKFVIKDILVIHTNVYPNYDGHLESWREKQRDNEGIDLYDSICDMCQEYEIPASVIDVKRVGIKIPFDFLQTRA